VKSVPGVGSVFSFKLPRVKPEAPEQPEMPKSSLH